MLARFLTATAALVLGTASLASAQTMTDIGTGDAVVTPLTTTVAEVAPGSSEWVAINWTSLHADARELKVTAVGSPGVTVGYPAFPVNGFSSGFWDDTLSANETDYTALKLTVAPDAPGIRAIDVTVSYVSDTGSHSQVITMPIGEAPPAGPTLTACDDMVIESFQQAPYSLSFQIRNATSDAKDFEFRIPSASYELTNLRLDGSGQNVNLAQIANDDGTFDIVLTGTVPAYQSIGGHQPNGFAGQLTPTSDDPFVLCS